MRKPKYRIVEEDGRFYPEKRFLGIWFRFDSGYPLYDEVFPSLEEASRFLDSLNRKSECQKAQRPEKIIHPYNLKQ